MTLTWASALDLLSARGGLNLLSIVVRFAVATFCSSIIGYERGKRSQAAGLRTHILVCIGATATMLVNQYITLYIDPASDPARMGAQVISGIGFLGAGTIVITGHHQSQRVKGLTTAAGLWASACMGLLVGIGFYEGALIMCAFLYLAIVMLNKLDERYLKRSSSVRIYLEYQLDNTPFSAILGALRNAGWHISDIEYLSQVDCGGAGVLLDLHNRDKTASGQQALDIVRGVEGVLFAEDPEATPGKRSGQSGPSHPPWYH